MKDYFSAYICPKCKEALMAQQNSLACINNHSFDIAKEGYVNLILANQKNSLVSGDTKEMIRARDEFLRMGYYDFLLENILRLDLVKKMKMENILEIGCGSGYYLNALNEAVKPALAMGSDVSKEAIKFAAKKYKDCFFSVNNSFNLSFKNDFFDLIVSIFSPFDQFEIEKVLREKGIFILVRPGKKHFAELYDLIGMPMKDKAMPEFENLKIVKSVEISKKHKVTPEELNLLIEMSPLVWKIKKLEDVKLKEMTFDFLISVYAR